MHGTARTRTTLAAINADQLATPTDRLLFAAPSRRSISIAPRPTHPIVHARRARAEVEQPTVYVREHLEPAQRFAAGIIIPMIGCALLVLAVLQ